MAAQRINGRSVASTRTEQAPYDGPPSAVPGTGRPNTDKREREASLHVAQEFGDKAAAALSPAKTDHLRTLIARGGIENALAVIGVMDFGGNALASSLVVGGASEMALALKQNGALQHHVLLRAAGLAGSDRKHTKHSPEEMDSTRAKLLGAYAVLHKVKQRGGARWGYGLTMPTW